MKGVVEDDGGLFIKQNYQGIFFLKKNIKIHISNKKGLIQ